MQFHERLQKLREQAGFSNAKAFAKALHIPYTTYQNYESGISEPKVSTLVRMANTLHTSIDKLVGYQPSTPDEFERTATLFHEATGKTATLTSTGVMITPKTGKGVLWLKPISKEQFIYAIQEAATYFDNTVRPLLLKDTILNNVIHAYVQQHFKDITGDLYPLLSEEAKQGLMNQILKVETETAVQSQAQDHDSTHADQAKEKAADPKANGKHMKD